jgi:hypothetical protein
MIDKVFELLDKFDGHPTFFKIGRIQSEAFEPLAKLSNGKRSKLIKAPDKPVF